jgi:hypothetical protein
MFCFAKSGSKGSLVGAARGAHTVTTAPLILHSQVCADSSQHVDSYGRDDIAQTLPLEFERLWNQPKGGTSAEFSLSD